MHGRICGYVSLAPSPHPERWCRRRPTYEGIVWVWVVGSQLHHVPLGTGHVYTLGEVNGCRLGNEVVQVSCQSQVILMLLLCSLLCSLLLGFTGSLGFDHQITLRGLSMSMSVRVVAECTIFEVSHDANLDFPPPIGILPEVSRPGQEG